MIGAKIGGREVVRLRPFRRAPNAYRGEKETVWGVEVRYKNRGGGINHKTFYYVDELGAFVAFTKHCRKLDDALFRKNERILDGWARRNSST